MAVARLVNTPQGRLLAPPAAGVPRPRTPLPPGQQTLVGLLPRRLRRRRTTERREAVHRAAEPPRSRHCSGLGGPPNAGLHPRPEGRSTGPHSGSGVAGDQVRCGRSVMTTGTVSMCEAAGVRSAAWVVFGMRAIGVRFAGA
jgi:hypothetical protein